MNQEQAQLLVKARADIEKFPEGFSSAYYLVLNSTARQGRELPILVTEITADMRYSFGGAMLTHIGGAMVFHEGVYLMSGGERIEVVHAVEEALGLPIETAQGLVFEFWENILPDMDHEVEAESAIACINEVLRQNGYNKDGKINQTISTKG